MDYYGIITTILTLVCGGGWFIHWREGKRKANGEASQAEAEGWKAQQDVYQQTIPDLEHSCDFIRQDRDLLRKENQELREENHLLRQRVADLETKMLDLQRDVARNARRIDAITKEKKKK